MSARHLAAVPPPKPKPKRRLRRITLELAAQAHPSNPEHQRRWAAAVAYLRTKTSKGWILDRNPKEKA